MKTNDVRFTTSKIEIDAGSLEKMIVLIERLVHEESRRINKINKWTGIAGLGAPYVCWTPDLHIQIDQLSRKWQQPDDDGIGYLFYIWPSLVEPDMHGL